MYIYNGILATKRNKTGSFVVTSMDLESVIQTEERRRKTNVHINTCRWNLEKWHRWTYLQGRYRDIDIKNGRQTQKGDGEDRTGREVRTDIHTLPLWSRQRDGACYTAQRGQLGTLWGREERDGGGAPSRGGDVYMYSWFTLLNSRHSHNMVKSI